MGDYLEVYTQNGDSIELTVDTINAIELTIENGTPEIGISIGSSLPGNVLSETDPIFLAWDKDYNDLINKPTIVTVTSGTALGSGRVVIMDGGKAIYFDPSNESHGGRFFGITKTSVSGPNLDVVVQTSGWFNASWLTLIPDTIYYIGTSGTMSTTPPIIGVVQTLGPSIDVNTIEINSNLFYIII